MTADVENRVVAFLGIMGKRCNDCLRRSEANCANCIFRFARLLKRDVDASNKPAEIDYSTAARIEAIRNALAKAGKPLFSHEIDTSALCSKQLKYWTLRQMMRLGMIRRSLYRMIGETPVYRYYLTPKTTKGATHDKGRKRESRPRTETGGEDWLSSI